MTIEEKKKKNEAKYARMKAIFLAMLDGRSAKEIAKEHGISPNYTYLHFWRGQQRISAKLRAIHPLQRTQQNNSDMTAIAECHTLGDCRDIRHIYVRNADLIDLVTVKG